MLFIVVSGFFMCLNGVSAVNVNIDNNSWTTNDINNYFSGITVHGLTISNGDNIIFQAGNYINLIFTVKNSVNIIANDAVNFIGKGTGLGITVSNANYVNISGIRVSNYTYGIYVSYSNNTGIFNNNASGNTKNGITLDTSSNTAIINNTANNNTNRGIYLSSSINSNVSNNIISNSLGNGGIISATSINSYIFNNTITQNVDGIYVYANSVNTTILNNIVNNNVNNGIVVGDTASSTVNNTIAYNTANNNNYQGIRLINTFNSTITNNTASNNKDNGIGLLTAFNSTITNNTVSNNANGINLASSTTNVTNNIVTNNKGTGITLSSSSNSNITNNNVSNNNGSGITLTSSTNSKIANNTVSNNKGTAMTLTSSSNSNITNNNISNNNGSGITLTSSTNSKIANNTVSNNKGYGINLTSSGNSNVTNNTVSNNNQNGIIVTGTGSSSIKNNTVYNNTLSGVRLENSGNYVGNNSIVNNGVGISIYAANNTLNYNRIYLNNLGLNNTGSNTNAMYNWWGSNNPNFTSLITGVVNYSPWLYMTITANSTSLIKSETSLITVSFNNLYNGSSVTALDPAVGHITDYILVNWTGTNGSINPTSNTLNGIATSIFTATTSGMGNITATSDNQTVYIQLMVNQTPTIIFVESTHNYSGQKVNLISYTFDYNGCLVNCGQVNYTVNGVNIGTVNVINGIATLNWTIPADWNTGNYIINAVYDGTETNYANSTNNNTLTIDQTPTTTTTTIYPIHNFPGQIIHLTTNINDFYNNPVNGGRIYYTLNGIDEGSAQIINGIAIPNWIIPNWNPDNYVLITTYDGTETNYANSTNNNTLTIDQTPTTITVDPIRNYPGQNVALTSHILDYYDNPISNGQVNYTVNGVNIGTVNVINDIATLNWTIPADWNTGNYIINAVYDGTETNYANSTNNNTLTIDQTPTTITVKNASVLDNQTVILKAILTNIYGKLVAGQTVVFNLNGHDYSAITDNNGVATINYIPYGSGTYTVTVNFMGNNNYTASVGTGVLNVTPAAYLYLKITTSKDKSKIGEIFTVTYKLGNKGPDNATNVTMTIPLPLSFTVSEITGNGNWVYNQPTNYIIWTLANVVIGDPYLYITGKINNCGVYAFSSSISSETYNLNTESVDPITITAENSTNPLTSTNSTAKIITTTQTTKIPMQHTGIPIAGLIVAILSVLGGTIMSSRK